MVPENEGRMVGTEFLSRGEGREPNAQVTDSLISE